MIKVQALFSSAGPIISVRADAWRFEFTTTGHTSPDRFYVGHATHPTVRLR
ncbi:MAG: hypothetical protein P8J84_07485 [Paracoccaceae bacterium]|nr:hypothetical protein [Paracoccaceae bacterium]